MKRCLRYLFVFGLFALAAPAAAQSNDALDRGEIFVHLQDVAGFDYPRLVVKAVVNAPPQKVYEIVSNCDRFPQRMPRVKEAKTLKRSASSCTCSVTVNLPFPMSDLTAVTVDQRKSGPDVWYRKWRLASGVETSYKHNVGGFELRPFKGDPNRTYVHYSIHAIPKTMVPDFMRKSAQKKSLPGMIERIRKEVKKL